MSIRPRSSCNTYVDHVRATLEAAASVERNLASLQHPELARLSARPLAAPVRDEPPPALPSDACGSVAAVADALETAGGGHGSEAIQVEARRVLAHAARLQHVLDHI